MERKLPRKYNTDSYEVTILTRCDGIVSLFVILTGVCGVLAKKTVMILPLLLKRNLHCRACLHYNCV